MVGPTPQDVERNMVRVSGHAIVVGAVWAALTVGLAVFVAKYGRNIPGWEEWLDLPVFFGDADRTGWVFGRLQEHRYVLGRAVLLAGFDLSGRDFRAGMVLSVAALAVAAAVLVRAAARVRGRTHVADILLPAAVLNPGGADNLFLGYQIQFTLSVLLAALLVRLAATADAAPPARVGAWAGLLTGLLALGGWVGLAFVPCGVAWVAFLAWRDRRLGGGWVRPVALLLLPAGTVGYFVWCYLDLRRHPLPDAPTNEPATAARVWGEFVSTAFGPLGEQGWPASAVVAAGGLAVVAAVLARSALVDPSRRASAAGWLVVVGAVGLMGYGVAARRTSGFAPRNFHLTALLIAVGHLTAVRYGPPSRWLGRVGTVAAVGVGVGLAYTGWTTGVRTAQPYQIWNDFYADEQQAGLPLAYLASRRQLFPNPHFRDAVRTLRDHGHPAGVGIPDGPPTTVEPLAVPRPERTVVPGDPMQAAVLGQPPVWRFDLGRERAVTGVRVRFRYGRSSLNVPFHVFWDDPNGPTKVAAGCFPWLIAGVWELDFWVNARVSAFWFRPLYGDEPIELLEVSLLRPAAP